MTKLAWLLAVLLIAHWIFTWQMTQWKIQELHKDTKQFSNQIDALSAEVNELKALLQPTLDDPSKWQKLIEQIQNQADQIDPL